MAPLSHPALHPLLDKRYNYIYIYAYIPIKLYIYIYIVCCNIPLMKNKRVGKSRFIYSLKSFTISNGKYKRHFFIKCHYLRAKHALLPPLQRAFLPDLAPLVDCLVPACFCCNPQISLEHKPDQKAPQLSKAAE